MYSSVTRNSCQKFCLENEHLNGRRRGGWKEMSGEEEGDNSKEKEGRRETSSKRALRLARHQISPRRRGQERALC